MNSRWLYTLKICWKFRNQLADYAHDQSLQAKNITNINPSQLFQQGIRGLILDFDGVLASHAEPHPHSSVLSWLTQSLEVFGKNNVYILSNKPMLSRKVFLQQHFPSIIFVQSPRKKPFPDGIQKIMELSKLTAQQLLVIDDRLATGIVAAASTEVPAILITNPLTNFYKRPIRESFFSLLRIIEKILL